MVKTIHRLITETIMTRMEILQRLQTIKNKGTQALKLLESKPLTVDAQAEIRSVAQWIKNELHNAYERISPERAQRTMSVFELTVYSPTIEERSGISRLKIDGVLDHKWEEPLETVVYNAGNTYPDDLVENLIARSMRPANIYCNAQSTLWLRNIQY